MASASVFAISPIPEATYTTWVKRQPVSAYTVPPPPPGYVQPVKKQPASAYTVSMSTSVTTYYQRARRVSTGALVYWSVTGDPDTTGASSGYAGDVTDIVILSIVTK